MTIELTPSPPVHVEPPGRHAFTLASADIHAIRDADLLRIGFDVPFAHSIALGTVQRIEPMLPMLALLPAFRYDRVSRLDIYADACLWAHFEAVEAKQKVLPELIEEASELREDLLMTAELLVRLGMTERERIESIRSGQGHGDLGNDLRRLSELFQTKWAEIGAKLPLTRDKVDRAGVVGAEVHRAIGWNLSPTGDTPQRVRERAVALLVQVYAECRRGVEFLRWYEGDVDAIVPSLYTKKRRRSATNEETAVPDEVSSSPGTTDDEGK